MTPWGSGPKATLPGINQLRARTMFSEPHAINQNHHRSLSSRDSKCILPGVLLQLIPPPLPPTTPSVGCLCHHRYQSHHLCSKPNHRCTHFMPFQLRDRLMNISRVARAQAAVDHHNLLKRKTKTPPSIRIRNGMPTD